MMLRARVLVENSIYGSIGAIAEHGWSVFIETLQANYLWDTGGGSALIHNAHYFGVDLASIEAIMISHHHIDHTGGVLSALQAIPQDDIQQTIPIYSHPDLFKTSYSRHPGKPLKYIGIPHSRSILETTGADFRFSRQWQQIGPGMYMTGEVPRSTTFESPDPDLVHRGADGRLVIDPIADDQSLVIDTPEGLVVLLACSHAGVINILNYIMDKTGKDHFHTVFGGTHLSPASQETIEQTIDALLDFDIDRVGVSHCTGPDAAAKVAQAFGDRFFYCSVGTEIEV